MVSVSVPDSAAAVVSALNLASATSVERITALPDWAQIAVVLALSLVAAKIIEVVGRYLLERWLSSEGYERVFFEETHTTLYVTVFLAGVYVVVPLLPEVGDIEFYISAIVLSLIVVLWAHAVIRVVNRAVSVSRDTPTDRQITPVFKITLDFFVVLASFFLLLSVWNVNITPLLASAGILGIIIGIAAQDSIGNFFGGISLYLDKTYKIGDMIQLESGERGTVVDMSIRSTTILTRDNVAVTVPNAEMNSTQVVNESAPARRRRIRLDVGVAYGSDLDTVEEALLECADDEELVLEKPNPVVRFRDFDDSAITAQLQCYIGRPSRWGRARHRLIKHINEKFREEEVKIPFPQRELTFFEEGNTVRLEHSYDDETEEPADENDTRGKDTDGDGEDDGREDGDSDIDGDRDGDGDSDDEVEETR